MRKIFKFILIFLAILPVIVSAAVKKTYGGSVELANNYINGYSTKDRYLILGSRIFGSDFGTNGGFITADEFRASLIGNSSYLSGGLSYWTQTSAGSNKYIISFGLVEKNPSEEHGARVVEYVRPETKIRGNGSIRTPWEFVEQYRVKIITNRNDVSISPSETNAIRGTSPKFDITEARGVMYSGVDDCGLVRTDKAPNGYTKEYSIPNISRDVTCTANFATRKIKITYSCGDGSGTTQSQTVTYGTSYTLNTSGCTRVGYHQVGWVTSTGDRLNYDRSGKVSGTWNIDEGEKGVVNNQLALTAVWEGNEYTITFYQGNGTSTAGASVIGSQTCIYGSSCKLKTYAELGATLPLGVKASGDPCDYAWGFYGWANATNSLTRLRTNGQTFTYNTATNSRLYVLEQRTIKFLGGVAPTSSYKDEQQIWNPYSTAASQLTSITLPTPPSISGWTFSGFVAGLNNADPSKITYNSSSPGTTVTPDVKVCKNIRSLYNRTITLTYNGNNSTSGSVANQTQTQYYNCGFFSGGANVGANVSAPTFTLAANGYNRSGYTFSKWAPGSVSGTQYNANSSYNGFAPAVNSSATTQTVYAIWRDTQRPTITIKAVDNNNSASTLQAAQTFNTDNVNGNIYQVKNGNWFNTNVKFEISLTDNEVVTSVRRRFNSAGQKDGSTTLDNYGAWNAATINSPKTGITSQNTVTSDGYRKLQYEFSDAAGNKTSFTVIVKLDKAAPNATFSLNSGSAKASATCSDALSGGSTGSQSNVSLTGSSYTLSGTCKDNAGNTANYSKTYTKSRADVCGTERYNYHDCMNCACSNTCSCGDPHNCPRSCCTSYSCKRTYQGTCTRTCYTGSCMCSDYVTRSVSSCAYTNCAEYCANALGKRMIGGSLRGYTDSYTCTKTAYDACCSGTCYDAACGDPYNCSCGHNCSCGANSCWDTRNKECWHE